MITIKDLENIIKSAKDEYANMTSEFVGKEVPQFECGFRDGIDYIIQELNYLKDRESSKSKFAQLLDNICEISDIDVSIEYIKSIVPHFDSEADYDDIQFIMISIKDRNFNIIQHSYWELETIVRDAVLKVMESYL